MAKKKVEKKLGDERSVKKPLSTKELIRKKRENLKYRAITNFAENRARVDASHAAGTIPFGAEYTPQQTRKLRELVKRIMAAREAKAANARKIRAKTRQKRPPKRK